MQNNSLVLSLVAILVAISSFFGGSYWNMNNHSHTAMQGMNMFGDMDRGEHREMFIAMRQAIQSEERDEGKYACCLEKPCTYCIEKTPGHGEEAACLCLDDVMNGRHPCGECIGEILEGHGNPLIAEYFASAIAEEVGVEYLDTLKSIISDKYGIAVAEQI